MQTSGDFFLVTLTVQLRQSPQHIDARSLRHGEANTVTFRKIGYFMKTMLEIKIVPPVSTSDCDVDLAMNCTQLFYSLTLLRWGMQPVIYGTKP